MNESILEGIDLTSCDNKTDILIAQLKGEVKKLMQSTENRLLCQDKKIAETMVYVKNNLSNSLRVLLAGMLSSGEMDEIISETITANITLLEDQVFSPGNVLTYGATGDGATDDTNAFILACDAARSCGAALIVPPGTYKITREINARYISPILVEGDIRNGSNAFLIGTNASSTPGISASFERIDTLKVMGCKQSDISFKYCDDLILYANGDDRADYSIAYSKFNGNYCKNITLFSEGQEIGWINENTFNIRRVVNISIDGNYDHNNNHFEHINLEKGTLDLLNARNNTFSYRGEGGVTVNTGPSSQVNFMEKEYYYEYDFADALEEIEHGGYIYHPVHKLEEERILYSLDSKNRQIPMGSLVFNENGTIRPVNYAEIFHTNRIKIDHTFALKFKTTSKVMRAAVNFYDENGSRIMCEVDNFTNTAMKYDPSGDWSYYVSVNQEENATIFYPGTAKYVEFRVYFGNGADQYSLGYIDVKLIKLVGTDVHVSCETKYNVYTQVPKTGYWFVGHRLYASSPKPGGYLGIVCTESGEPGTWVNFASVKES